MPSLAQLERLLALEPGDAFLLYAVAQEHSKSGDTPAAVEYYDRCLATDPTYCYAYYHKARALLASSKVAQAAAAADEGIRVAQRTGDGKALVELTSLRDEMDV